MRITDEVVGLLVALALGSFTGAISAFVLDRSLVILEAERASALKRIVLAFGIFGTMALSLFAMSWIRDTFFVMDRADALVFGNLFLVTFGVALLPTAFKWARIRWRKSSGPPAP